MQPSGSKEYFEQVEQNFQGTIFDITLDVTTFEPQDNTTLRDEFIF